MEKLLRQQQQQQLQCKWYLYLTDTFAADWPKVWRDDDNAAAAPAAADNHDDLRNNSLHLADTNAEVVVVVVLEVAVANVAWLLAAINCTACCGRL